MRNYLTQQSDKNTARPTDKRFRPNLLGSNKGIWVLEMGVCDCLRGTILALVRCTLCILNIFFVLAGGAIVTVATIIFINTEDWWEFYTRNMHKASIVCLVSGCMTVAFAIFGLYAVLKNTPILWRTYSGLMLVTFGCLLAGGICTLSNKTNLITKAQANMIDLMDKYSAPEPNAGGSISAKDSWDRLQIEFRCCGINATRDWSPDLGGYPDSCLCENGSKGCSALEDRYYFDQGCFEKLRSHSLALVDVQSNMALTVSGFQLLSVIFSLSLAHCLSSAAVEYISLS